MLNEKLSGKSEVGDVSDLTLHNEEGPSARHQKHDDDRNTGTLVNETGFKEKLLYVDPATEEFYY